MGFLSLRFFCAFVVVCCLTVLAAAAPLTVAQLLKLIAVNTPDQIVAAEVIDRGLKDTIDRGLIDSVRKAGAGPLTLSALDKIRPRSKLNVKGAKGTNVRINGDVAGQIGESGALLLDNLWPGRYELVAELREHASHKEVVMLEANVSADVFLDLRSVYGFLSLVTSPAGAEIEIEGVSRLQSPVQRQQLPVGRYVLKVNAPYHTQYAETIDLAGGESIERNITLTVDPQQLQSLLTRMRQKLSATDFKGVVNDASAYLKIAPETDLPGRAAALTHLSLASIHTRDYAEAASAGVRALDLGGTLSLKVKYNSATPGYLYMADGTVSVTSTSVKFEATFGYGDESFTVSPNKILEAVVESAAAGRLHLTVAVMTRRGDREQRKTYYLYSSGARAVGGGPGGAGARLDCSGCDDSMSVLRTLLMKVRGG